MTIFPNKINILDPIGSRESRYMYLVVLTLI